MSASLVTFIGNMPLERKVWFHFGYPPFCRRKAALNSKGTLCGSTNSRLKKGHQAFFQPIPPEVLPMGIIMDTQKLCVHDRIDMLRIL